MRYLALTAAIAGMLTWSHSLKRIPIKPPIHNSPSPIKETLPSLLNQLINREADNFEIPRHIFHALIETESSYRINVHSPVGAIGLGQIMPENIKRCGLKTKKDLETPKLNLKCAGLILREEYDIHKSWTKALVIYNCGSFKCSSSYKYAAKVLLRAKDLFRSKVIQ